MSSGHRLFVHSQMSNNTSLLGLLATLHGSFHEIPGLVPTDPQQPGTSLNVRLQQHINGMLLKGSGEASFRKRPRNENATHTMFEAKHPWQTRMQPGDASAMIQVPPLPRRSVIINRQRHLTLRASKRHPAAMLQRDINLFSHRRENDALYLPGRCQPQKPRKECRVTHGLAPPGPGFFLF